MTGRPMSPPRLGVDPFRPPCQGFQHAGKRASNAPRAFEFGAGYGNRMSEGGRDPVTLAVARLEMAVERLAARPVAEPGRCPRRDGRGGDAPSLRAEVAALAARLDASIARLREVVRAESEPPAPPAAGAAPPGRGEDEEE